MTITMADVLHLEKRHYALPGKDRASDIGQAIDAAMKELVAPLGAVISHQFDPHDYRLNEMYHEIKSSVGTWLSIPNSETEFAEMQLGIGSDVIYDVVLQLDLRRARLLGSVPYSKFRHMIEPSKFLTWRKLEEGWSQERSHCVLLSKVKSLLT